jgi:hypothetical protein
VDDLLRIASTAQTSAKEIATIVMLTNSGNIYNLGIK